MREYVELRAEGIFTHKEFNKVRGILHPDNAQGETEQKRYAEAFAIFSRCEKLLKKEPLPKSPELPKTIEEWNEARLQVKKQNSERARRAADTRARKKPGRQLSEQDAVKPPPDDDLGIPEFLRQTPEAAKPKLKVVKDDEAAP